MKAIIGCIFLFCLGAYAQPWATKAQALTGSSSAFQGNSHSWADVDGDGDYDLFIDNGTLWINDVNHSGVFINSSGLVPGISGGIWSSAFGDYNNDGKPDLHLAMGTSGTNQILENRYPSAFVDVAADYGYNDSEFCQPAYWADYNRDGLLDFYVTHENPGEPNEFWQSGYPNNFIPRFPTAGGQDKFGLADLNSHAYGLTWGDIDLDGDIDVVTSACGSNTAIPGQRPYNKVYENRTEALDGNPNDSFVNRTLSIGVVDQAEIQAGSDAYWATLFDYDNDGWPDLFIGDNDGQHRLWHNTGQTAGDFGFEQVPAGTHHLQGNGAYGHTAVAGDWDNDGDLDLYLTNAGLFRNDGGGSFTLTNHVPSTNSFNDASFVDYDGDGWLDVLNQGNLYQNPGGTNHWLSVELEGLPSMGTPRSAHGAKIRVTSGGKVQTREHRFMVGTYSQQMLPTHFGLGTATTIDEVRVIWPNGDETVLNGVGIDQQITIAELADCSGSLVATTSTDIVYCHGDTVELSANSSNAVGVHWRVQSGPATSSTQFSSPDALATLFTPAQAGSYRIVLEYFGCPDSAVEYWLHDSDFNLDGDYDGEDLLVSLPTWQTSEAISNYDLNQDGAHDIRDMLIQCQ